MVWTGKASQWKPIAARRDRAWACQAGARGSLSQYSRMHGACWQVGLHALLPPITTLIIRPQLSWVIRVPLVR